MVTWVYRAAALSLLVGIVSCSSPPPPPPTVVNLTVSASPTVNPTASGQAAPIVVRVYQLGSTTGFEQAEFFQLFNQDQAFLKTDMVKRDDFLLTPGQTKTATLAPTDQVKALGVLAAYRDFQHTTWRATVPVPPHQTTNVTVSAGTDAVVVKAEAVKSGS
jgi:type VI secretion system protein VasD